MGAFVCKSCLNFINEGVGEKCSIFTISVLADANDIGNNFSSDTNK